MGDFFKNQQKPHGKGERNSLSLSNLFDRQIYCSGRDNCQSYFSEQVTFKSLVHKGVFYSMRCVRVRSVETIGRDPRATHYRIQ